VAGIDQTASHWRTHRSRADKTQPHRICLSTEARKLTRRVDRDNRRLAHH